MVERDERPSVASRVATAVPDATSKTDEGSIVCRICRICRISPRVCARAPAYRRFTGGGNPSRGLGAFPIAAIKDATDATDATVRWAKRRSHLYSSILRVATDATGADPTKRQKLPMGRSCQHRVVRDHHRMMTVPRQVYARCSFLPPPSSYGDKGMKPRQRWAVR
jgi:hypothetical protein